MSFLGPFCRAGMHGMPRQIGEKTQNGWNSCSPSQLARPELQTETSFNGGPQAQAKLANACG
jgi:hypothetical protein